MISQSRQRLISVGLLAAAVGALVLAAIYQDDNKLDDPSFVGIERTSADSATGAAGTSSGQEGETPTTLAGVSPGERSPIERFLPVAGEAVACREAVGVDLLPGYGARLTINGSEIAPEEMNVVLDDTGAITNEITASRSVGHFTFMPTDKCPNGRYLRPVDNVLEVCVYRFDDVTSSCAIQTRHIFDAL